MVLTDMSELQLLPSSCSHHVVCCVHVRVGSGGLYQGRAQELAYRVPLCSGGGEADPVRATGHWAVP